MIAKRRDSPYEHRRSPHWLKMKCEASQELVVGGFTDPQGARVGLGALLVGYFEGDDFVFAGKVGTGFDTKLLLDLRARLDALEIPKPPFTKAIGLPRLRAHWVRPEIVVQVAFIEWTVHGKLRHPRLLGVRTDKTAARGGAGVTRDHASREGAVSRTTGSPRASWPRTTKPIAPVMLPHIRGRPVTMERYPAGIGAKGFMQKDVSKGFPDWLERVEVPKKGGTVHYPLVNDARSLLWLANQNTHHAARLDVARAAICITPTSASSISIRRTTIRTSLRAAALALRDLLDELGLPSWVKTSGSKGFHIVVPLDGKTRDRRGRAVRARRRRRCSSERDPEHLTQEFSKADRGGRISSTPAATATARRSPPPTPCAPGPARRCRRRARGRRSSAATVGADDVHAAEHGRTRRGGRGSVGRDARSAQPLREAVERLKRLSRAP